MFEAALGLFRGTAFDTEYDIARAFVLDDSDDSRPIYDAVATGTAYRRAGNLPAFGVGVLDGNIFCVQMNQAIGHAFHSGIRSLAGKVSVTRIEIDADSR